MSTCGNYERYFRGRVACRCGSLPVCWNVQGEESCLLALSRTDHARPCMRWLSTGEVLFRGLSKVGLGGAPRSVQALVGGWRVAVRVCNRWLQASIEADTRSRPGPKADGDMDRSTHGPGTGFLCRGPNRVIFSVGRDVRHQTMSARRRA